MAFKRASLTGSAQLFQPTKVSSSVSPGEEDSSEPEMLVLRPPDPPLVSERPQPHLSQGHLYRLSEDDVEVILNAIQHAKFPHSYQRMAKPALEEFEQLEALRQKITEQRQESL